MDERTHARYMSDIAYFLSKMEAEPNSGYFIPIALAYNKLEKYDETIAMCKTAIERFPANCAAKTFLAEAYVYKGQFELAKDYLFDVTAEDDNNYKALKLLGIICKENGDTAEAIKYLTGAYIRSPEDKEVRAMIEELGGSLNPAQIYDERMKRQSQAAYESEEDEELRTFQEIDQRIRNAEIIMADLVSDTSITARNYAEEEDINSDNPNDFMPLIETHEPVEEDTDSDSVENNDNIENVEDIAENSNNEEHSILSEEESSNKEDNDLLSALSEEESSDTSENDLLSALAEDESKEDNDLLSALSEEESSDTSENDLLSALAEDDNKEDNDLLSALSEEESSDTSENDLLSALGEDDNKEDNDLLSALSEEESSDTSENDLLSALAEDDNKEDNNLLSELSEDSQEEKIEEEPLQETDTSLNVNSVEEEKAEDIEELANIENEEVIEENKEQEVEENIEVAEESESKKELSEEDKLKEELYNRKLPNSIADMTYNDMIDDDFQYGNIVEDNYNESDMPSVDLGESAPFTQGDIMDEILDAVGMTQEDMANDEQIELSDKERRLIRLEQFLDKVRHSKESK